MIFSFLLSIFSLQLKLTIFSNKSAYANKDNMDNLFLETAKGFDNLHNPNIKKTILYNMKTRDSDLIFIQNNIKKCLNFPYIFNDDKILINLKYKSYEEDINKFDKKIQSKIIAQIDKIISVIPKKGNYLDIYKELIRKTILSNLNKNDAYSLIQFDVYFNRCLRYIYSHKKSYLTNEYFLALDSILSQCEYIMKIDNTHPAIYRKYIDNFKFLLTQFFDKVYKHNNLIKSEFFQFKLPHVEDIIKKNIFRLIISISTTKEFSSVDIDSFFKMQDHKIIHLIKLILKNQNEELSNKTLKIFLIFFATIQKELKNYETLIYYCNYQYDVLKEYMFLNDEEVFRSKISEYKLNNKILDAVVEKLKNENINPQRVKIIDDIRKEEQKTFLYVDLTDKKEEYDIFNNQLREQILEVTFKNRPGDEEVFSNRIDKALDIYMENLSEIRCIDELRTKICNVIFHSFVSREDYLKMDENEEFFDKKKNELILLTLKITGEIIASQ